MHRVGLPVLVACVVLVVLGFAWNRRSRKVSHQEQGVAEFDPKTVLFSVPTICDEAPETVQNPVHDSPDAFRIHEDDWRQIEFIEGVGLPEIDREMADIETFKDANRAAMG